MDPKQIWHSQSFKNQGSNFIGYNNPKADELIDKGRLTMDKNARMKIWQELYQVIADDYPYAFLFNSEYDFYGKNKRIAQERETYTYGVGIDYWWAN